jgi:hypothetical protein
MGWVLMLFLIVRVLLLGEFLFYLPYFSLGLVTDLSLQSEDCLHCSKSPRKCRQCRHMGEGGSIPTKHACVQRGKIYCRSRISKK